MQRLGVSGAVRLIYRSLGVKGLILFEAKASSVFTYLLVDEVHYRHDVTSRRR